MKKWTLIYVLISLAWIAYNLTINGGEAAIGPFLLTVVLTVPTGLLFWFTGAYMPEPLIIPLMLILNYFQWLIFYKIYIKIRIRKTPNK